MEHRKTNHELRRRKMFSVKCHIINMSLDLSTKDYIYETERLINDFSRKRSL